MMIIRKAIKSDILAIAEMAVLMWSNNSIDDLTNEFENIVDTNNGVIFIADEKGELVGFAQCWLRYDYVEGTDSSPVGYLEGIFVKKEYRNNGYAKLLLQECEKWAILKGCFEFASDCELNNDNSLSFHLNAGFTEANRIICFTKKLK